MAGAARFSELGYALERAEAGNGAMSLGVLRPGTGAVTADQAGGRRGERGETVLIFRPEAESISLP